MSGAVHEALYTTEVILRNAIDLRIGDWNVSQTDPSTGRSRSIDWLLDPANLLVRLIRRDTLDEAIRRARQAGAPHGRALRHCDVLTQLGFSTWRFLLPDRDPGRQLLWRQALVNAFPHLRVPPPQLVAEVDGIYKLRNKCAHMESLLDSRNIRRQYQNMRSVLQAISPAADQWFTSTQRVTAALRDRPQPSAIHHVGDAGGSNG
ncbi:MAG: hypothetical protein LBK59_07185 [Bifidobacteriaceae bacterium]|jgi:hypothetical protein|nr:hypothetical protein [Bifidobacteriaceae bacterium]